MKAVVQQSELTRKGLPRHLQFPAAWKHVTSHGVGPFVTRVVHRLPDNSLHIWTSRRHRKQRNGKILPACHVSDPENLHSSHPALVARHKSFRLWGWQPQRLTWWIGLIFILGSICFVLGTVPMAYGSVAKWLGWSGQLLNAICFAGSVFFTVGSYLLVLEAVNANCDLRLEMRLRKLEHLLAGETFEIPHRRKFKLWGWAWDRIDYNIAAVQLTGALIFNINCGMALVAGLNWIEADAWVWTPSTLASCCFVVAGYLGVLEVCHRWFAWMPRDMTWWINIFGVLGAIGFFTSSVVGYFGQGPIQLPQWWGNMFALMMGSWFFLFGTYLLIPEMYLQDDT